MASKRLDPKQRTQQILNAAVRVAKKSGYLNITREAVAAEAGCSIGLVTLRFETMTQLKRAVIRQAVKERVLEVIAQGIVARDTYALRAPEELKKQAVAALT
jgi:AcrR family transcriptional regulator